MLEVVSTVRSPSKADQHAGFFPTSDRGEDNFMVDDNLLDYIDFTCCDVPSSFFDDILPDLEADPTELLAGFKEQTTTVIGPASHHGGAAETKPPPDDKEESPSSGGEEKKDQKRLLEGERQKKKNGGGDEVLSAVTMDDSAAADTKSSASAEAQISKKKTKPSKNSHGNKKKVKVDWTPELHRRFVQAVEQLGIDKAVPSRILEIMGIDRLTRHNIASHLQKYRSHRKHLMAREAERQTMYAAAATAAAMGGQVVTGAPRTKDDMPAAGPWVAPTIGFPPPFVRPPLHVWGHPPTAVEAAAPVLPVWPRHLAPPPSWAPVVVDPRAYWPHQQYNNAARKWAPQAVTQGTPCVQPPMPPPAMLPSFPAQPPVVAGMMPHPMPMYRPIPPPPHKHTSKLASLQLQLDAQPSKESIDAAIGDVLVKPWLPLPLGLKPPSLDSVMSELHKQGIPKIPPAATSGS